ncbi:MAG: DUF1552 domain-containing protein [Myxococcota bacterium]
MRRTRFSRRRFLMSAGGAALGVPLLDVLKPRGAGLGRAQATTPDRRLIVFFTCNGYDKSRFHPLGNWNTPLNAERLPEGQALSAVRDYADRMLVLRGVHTVPRGYYDDPAPGCEHDKGMGSKLTAQPLDPDTYFPMGESVDQLIARRINPGGRAPLTLMVGPYDERVNGMISSRGPNAPVFGENNPWTAYQRITGLVGDEGGMDRVLRRRESVLDVVGDDLEELRALPMSARDRMKLETHVESVRQLELDLVATGLCGDRSLQAELELIDPANVVSEAYFKQMGRLQTEVLALAMRCGGQRVATLQWGSGARGPIFRWDGMEHEYNHHKISHGNTRDDDSGAPLLGALDMMHQIDSWYAQRFADLLDVLDDADEGEHGSVLDQSAVLWINELSDGAVHDYKDLPVVLAGSAGGRLTTGRYLKMTRLEDVKSADDSGGCNKLLNTLINVMTMSGPGDARTTDFGWEGAPPGEFRELESDWT